jgi:hypothetical protein
VPPVRRRLHADIGSPGGCAFAQRAHVILHNRHAAIETLCPEPLFDQSYADGGILFEQF